jgi:hypothetical protein
MNIRNKILDKYFLGASGNRSIDFTATFFLSKKSSQKSQDGQPHNLAIKTPVLIPYPRTRPAPASRSFGIIPPHLEHMKFRFKVENFEICQGRSIMRMHL